MLRRDARSYTAVSCAGCSWARPLLWVLLLGTAALDLVDLSSSSTANSFSAATVTSGTESLKA